MTTKGEEPYFSRIIPENLPSDWDQIRLSTVCSFHNGENLPSEKRKEGLVPVYGSNGIVDYHTESRTKSPSIIVGRKGSAGAINYSEEEAFVIDTAYYINPQPSNYNIKWLYYLLKSLQLEDQSEDSAVPGMNRKLIRAHIIPFPDLNTQTKIADFLDHKTAKIDHILNNYQKILDKLKEKKNSLIYDEVINDVGSNNTDIDHKNEWVNKIPSEWNILKLKWGTTKIGSGVTPKGGSKNYLDEGIIFLRSQNIHFEGLDLEDVAYIDKETNSQMKNSQVEPRDVLLNITGASIGRCCIVPKDFSSANVNQHVCIIRPKKNIFNPEFLNYIISSTIVQHQIFSEQEGASREAVTFEQIGSFYIPRPPLDEQKSIVTRLDHSTNKIKQAINNISDIIRILRKKRQSLITHAITGQLNLTDE